MSIATQPNTLDLSLANQQLAGMSAEDILTWSHHEYGRGLRLLSSFGADSGLMIKMLAKAGLDIEVLTIDTGFLFDETIEHRERLQRDYNFKLRVIGPSPETITAIKESNLWEHDLDLYNELTKLEPHRRAVTGLGITALLSGVRSWQTEHRAEKDIIELGTNGEHRIHPILFWSQEQSDNYLANVPEHPLLAWGYDSVGDWTITQPGSGRSGRGFGKSLECGLHL